MTELTKEQIAQGWKLHDGRNCPFRTNNHLCEVIDFDGIMHAGYGVSDQYAWVHEYRGPSDEIEAYCVWAYRTFSPDLPSPPVLGEAMAQLEKLKAERDEARLHTAKVNNSVFGSWGYFTTPDASEEIERLKESNGNHWNIEQALRAEITRLTSQLEQAERVIAPFADAAESLTGSEDDDAIIAPAFITDPKLGTCDLVVCCVDDIRTASQWIKDRQANYVDPGSQEPRGGGAIYAGR